MALNRKAATEVVKKVSESDWGNLKAGDHEGRLVMVADLGLQAREFAGEFKGNFQQLSLGIEIIGATSKSEDDTEYPRILWTRPFYIYDDFPESGNEFEYYSMFDPSAVEGTIPDWESQLGKPISVTVENVDGVGKNKGSKFDNIKSLSKIPEKYQGGVGEAISEMGIGDSEDSENMVTKGLYGLTKHVWSRRIIEDEAPLVTKEKSKKSVDTIFAEEHSPF